LLRAAQRSKYGRIFFLPSAILAALALCRVISSHCVTLSLLRTSTASLPVVRYDFQIRYDTRHRTFALCPNWSPSKSHGHFLFFSLVEKIALRRLGKA
jgi:hypothetical protein